MTHGATNDTALARMARVALVLPVVFVCTFVLWPTVSALRKGLDPAAMFGNAGVRSTLWFTTWQAFVSTVVTLIVGTPVAWLLSRHEFAGRRMIRALTLVPFVLPTLVVGLAFRAVLPGEWRTGVLPLIIAHVFLNVAVVVRIVGVRIESQPHSFDEAAATLGAGPTKRLITVSWPMLRGSVLAAAGLVFMYCFSTYGAARVLAGPLRPTVETEIYRLAVLAGDMRSAAVLAVAQIVMVGAVLALTSRGATVASTPVVPVHVRSLTRVARTTVGIGALVVAVVFAVPLVGLAINSVRVGGRFSLAGWRGAFDGSAQSADVPSALVASLSVAVVAAAIAVVVGLAVAIARVHAESRGTRGVAVACEILPVIVSAVVVGLGFILTFRRDPVDWRGSWWLLAVAHAVVALPLVSRSIVESMRRIPPDLRSAAGTLGASPLRAFGTVDLALLRRPLASATTLAALVSLGEFGSSSLLSRRSGETLTIAVGRLLGRPGDVMVAQTFVAATVLGVACVALVWFVDLAAAGSPT